MRVLEGIEGDYGDLRWAHDYDCDDSILGETAEVVGDSRLGALLFRIPMFPSTDPLMHDLEDHSWRVCCVDVCELLKW